MTLVEILTVVFVAATTLISAYMFGGRKWKGEAEVSERKENRLEATLVEKDKLIEGMSERLARLDEQLAETGGWKVYEAVMTHQKEIATLFGQIAAQLSTMASNSTKEHERMVGLIQAGFVELHQLAKEH